MIGARSGLTPIGTFGVSFGAPIVSECCQSARFCRSDSLAGASFRAHPCHPSKRHRGRTVASAAPESCRWVVGPGQLKKSGCGGAQ